MLVSGISDSCPTYALLDSGATCSAIASELVDIIGNDITQIPLTLKTFSSETSGFQKVTSFTIQDLNETMTLKVENALISDSLSSNHDKPPKNEIKRSFPHLHDVHFNELKDTRIGLILDAKFARHWVPSSIRMGQPNQPLAALSNFGWYLIGPNDEPDSTSTTDDQPLDDEDGTTIHTIQTEEQAIQSQIQHMFQHDFIGRLGENFSPEVSHPSQYDEFSKCQLEETVRFDEGEGKYRIGLPWKWGREKTTEILNNLDTLNPALNRLNKLKHKMNKNPILKEGSFKQMEESIAKGQIQVLDQLEVPSDRPVCYLANHVVTHPDKPGKYRICQDAAARVAGTCLNDLLLTGPDYMNSLIGILFRFRRGRIALWADVEDFFHQILVDEKDVAVLRFPWWKSRDMKEVVMLQSLVHIFGNASSPTIANFILRHHAEKIKNDFPLYVYLAILYCFYVDDYLDSVNTVEDAKQLRTQLTAALAAGGFNLRKWASNFPEVLEEYDAPSNPSDSPAAAPTNGEAPGANGQEEGYETPLNDANVVANKSLKMTLLIL